MHHALLPHSAKHWDGCSNEAKAVPGAGTDHAAAAEYYSRAVGKDSPEGLHNLAYMHQHGLGVQQVGSERRHG